MPNFYTADCPACALEARPGGLYTETEYVEGCGYIVWVLCASCDYKRVL